MPSCFACLLIGLKLAHFGHKVRPLCLLAACPWRPLPQAPVVRVIEIPSGHRWGERFCFSSSDSSWCSWSRCTPGQYPEHPQQIEYPKHQQRFEHLRHPKAPATIPICGAPDWKQTLRLHIPPSPMDEKLKNDSPMYFYDYCQNCHRRNSFIFSAPS